MVQVEMVRTYLADGSTRCSNPTMDEKTARATIGKILPSPRLIYLFYFIVSTHKIFHKQFTFCAVAAKVKFN